MNQKNWPKTARTRSSFCDRKFSPFTNKTWLERPILTPFSRHETRTTKSSQRAHFFVYHAPKKKCHEEIQISDVWKLSGFSEWQWFNSKRLIYKATHCSKNLIQKLTTKTITKLIPNLLSNYLVPQNHLTNANHQSTRLESPASRIDSSCLVLCRRVLSCLVWSCLVLSCRHPSILSIHPSINPSDPFIHLAYPFINSSIHPSFHLIHPFILSIHPSILSMQLDNMNWQETKQGHAWIHDNLLQSD